MLQFSALPHTGRGKRNEPLGAAKCLQGVAVVQDWTSWLACPEDWVVCQVQSDNHILYKSCDFSWLGKGFRRSLGIHKVKIPLVLSGNTQDTVCSLLRCDNVKIRNYLPPWMQQRCMALEGTYWGHVAPCKQFCVPLSPFPHTGPFRLPFPHTRWIVCLGISGW